ncbi:MAG: type I restriction enzyme HsdR N-terminal domain-containing protein [Aggregatilineales bacterium]
MQRAQSLIRQKRYTEAREVLKSIRSRQAKQLLKEIDDVATFSSKSSKPIEKYTSSISDIYPMPWIEALVRSAIQWTMFIILVTLISYILVRLDNSSTTLSDGTIERGSVAQAIRSFSNGICFLSPLFLTLGSLVIAERIRIASMNNKVWSLFHMLRVPFIYNSIVVHIENIFWVEDTRYEILPDADPRTSASNVDITYPTSINLSSDQYNKELPENIIHDYIVRELINTFGYPRNDIATEFKLRMGSSSKRADVVIFNRGASHIQENIVAIVECKKMLSSSVSNDRLMGEGESQLKSYMASCINARFGAVAGSDWKAFELVKGHSGNTFHELSQFPSATGANVNFNYAPR